VTDADDTREPPMNRCAALPPDTQAVFDLLLALRRVERADDVLQAIYNYLTAIARYADTQDLHARALTACLLADAKPKETPHA